MGKVKRFTYRNPVTPEGLKKMERDELDWFDVEMFSNFNTGVLEEYLDEKNRTRGFNRSKFQWRKVIIGVLIGSAFAVINQYIGLKIGLVVGGAWYIMYLLGLMFRWSPTEINLTSGSATGADRTCTGFVFSFPAIYLLAYHASYEGAGGSRIVPPEAMETLLPVALISAMAGGLMGVMYFIIFRRIWLIEDPLPAPGFQASVKLMDIANDISKGAVEQARRSIRLVLMFLGITMFLTFLRDFPMVVKDVFGHPGATTKVSLMDDWFGPAMAHDPSAHYYHGHLNMSVNESVYTQVGFSFSGIAIAIGWFLRFRTAFLVGVGCLLTWFVIVPMMVGMQVPIYVASVDSYLTPQNAAALISLTDPTAPALEAARTAKVIAIGAILGGGITALAKMMPTFKTVISDIQKSKGEGRSADWIPGKGWYNWPGQHIKIMMMVAGTVIATVFIVGGFPVLQSIAFGGLLVLFTFLLGAIAVKVSGEVGTTPVSGTSFICLLMLWGVFTALAVVSPYDDPSGAIVMALVGTTVFGTSISLASDITWDFKVGIYCGTRPYHMMKAETTGIVVGISFAAMGAVMFSKLLASGELDLPAPQAHAFAIFAQMLSGGNVSFALFGLGLCIGIFIELLTGMGTAFGLGMYLPLGHTLAIMTGGAARDIWEKKILEPKAEREGWDERKRTFKLLDTYMIATGLLIGEAVMGTIIAFTLVLSGG